VEPVDPDAYIKSISKEGEVILRFTKPMVVAPLDFIISSTVEVNNQKVPVIFLSINPGYYSNTDDLTFTYNITSYTAKQMKIQLNFDRPLYVSKERDDLDYLVVIFYGQYYFFDTDGLLMTKNKKLRKAIPTQIPVGGTASSLSASGDAATAAS